METTVILLYISNVSIMCLLLTFFLAILFVPLSLQGLSFVLLYLLVHWSFLLFFKICYVCPPIEWLFPGNYYFNFVITFELFQYPNFLEFHYTFNILTIFCSFLTKFHKSSLIIPITGSFDGILFFVFTQPLIIKSCLSSCQVILFNNLYCNKRLWLQLF